MTAATARFAAYAVRKEFLRLVVLTSTVLAPAIAFAQATPAPASRQPTAPAALASWRINPSAVKSPATQPATQPTTQPIRSPLIDVAEPRVLIVSIDGLRPDCLLRAETPNIRALMKRGSFSLWARTTDMAVTTPSHVSMLTGVTPEVHGISFNSDPPEGARILVPTLFRYAKEAGLSTGLASGKRKFSLFIDTDEIDSSAISVESTTADGSVAAWADRIIREHQPRLMVVHFPGPDNTGHAKGWGTPQQLETIAEADRALGVVLAAYAEADLMESTYVILSADHGGSMRTHGRDDVRSRYIPWIFAGPGVRADYDLTRLGKDYDIATYDTFSTAAYVLGLNPQGHSDGKPVLPSFKAYDLMQSDVAASPATQPTAAQPTTTPAVAIP